MKKYWIVKNNQQIFKCVLDGYAVIGWSNVKLASFEDKDKAIGEVCKLYGGSSRTMGRTKGTILRFLSIQKDEIVIVP